MPRGGARPNSGPKKGTKYKSTIERAILREEMRNRLLKDFQPVIQSLVDSAKGVPVLLMRDEFNKWHRVTSAEGIETALNAKADGDDRNIRIYAEDPDVKALQQFFDRLLGPVAVEVSGPDGAPVATKIVHTHLPADKVIPRVQ